MLMISAAEVWEQDWPHSSELQLTVQRVEDVGGDKRVRCIRSLPVEIVCDHATVAHTQLRDGRDKKNYARQRPPSVSPFEKKKKKKSLKEIWKKKKSFR